MRTTRLRVRLREVAPAVVRVLDVPSAASLPELHHLLQASMGWVDAHLHEFDTGAARYGPDPDEVDTDLAPPVHDEAGYRLRDLPARWVYRYDFGDGWTHDVEVLGRGGERPGCPYGEGGCPPEDCGGPAGHTELEARLAGSDHEQRAEIRAWLGVTELPGFDVAATDLLVRQTAGSVPESVRLVLDAAADGVKLTAGGRLPRAFVRTIQAHRPHWAFADRPAHLEEDLIPLAALHDLLRSVGLLRLRHGVLRPTTAAGDDLAVLRRLRSWFGPEHCFAHLLAADAIALLAADGPTPRDQLAARMFELLGPGWAYGGVAITGADVRRELARLEAVLEGLDQITDHGPRLHPGPSALWLLPHAVGLAAVWAPGSGIAQPHYAGQ